VNAIDVLRSLYAVSGSALVLAYVPQFVTVWKCRDGARGVSLVTWGAWCAAAVVSFLYACCVVQDRSYGMVTGGSAIGCFAVTGLATLKRVRHRRGMPASAA